MYTQCPDCDTVFRVTAEVLKQAAGKVRCGGCGIAFNALDYLSEQKPEPRVREEQAASLPELEPEPDEPAAEQSYVVDRAEGPTGLAATAASISAEQSAALLKTLDDLAGSEVRIEDTGIEWRVVDDTEDPQAPDTRTVSGTATADQTGSMRFFLEEDAGGDDRRTGIEASGAGESLEDTQDASLDELLDDDRETGPGDDPLDPEPESEHPTSSVSDGDPVTPDESVPETELVGETPPKAEEMRFDDNTPLPDDFGLEEDDAGSAASEVQDPSDTGLDTVADAGEPSAEDQDLQVDLALGDPDEWEQLLDEVDDTPEASVADRKTDECPREAAAEDTEIGGDRDGDVPAAGSELESEDGGREDELTESVLAGEFDEQAMPGDSLSHVGELGPDDDLSDIEAPVGEEALANDLSNVVEDVPVEEALANDLSDVIEDVPVEDTTTEEASDESPSDTGEVLSLEETADEEPSDAVGDFEFEASSDDAASDIEELSLGEVPDDRSAEKSQDEVVDGESAGELEVPPETEEEQTINRMIDRDLLALAMSDDEGHASTIAGERDEPDDMLQVETIIMEGEVVRDVLEEQRLAAEAAAADDLDEAVEHDEIVLPPKETPPPEHRPVNRGMWAGVLALALALALQLAHQSRESLATTPAFNKSLAPVYRLLGQPVTPAWDITGWRFEATRGSTDQADEVLTIYSRIGNNSPDALPYPLITVSLTDRFEEMIGSRVVEPAEYLAEDIDSGRLVPPDQSFEAVISLAAPDALATSYRLSACYRQADSRLRCAMEDFR